MLYLKRCPKCRGDLYLDDDRFGAFLQCLQCGFLRDVAKMAAADGTIVKPATLVQPAAVAQPVMKPALQPTALRVLVGGRDRPEAGKESQPPESGSDGMRVAGGFRACLRISSRSIPEVVLFVV